MTAVCFYFQVHQPMRLRRLQSFRSPAGLEYWDEEKNRALFDRAADKCYLPTNALIEEQIRKTDGWFRVAYSLSGVFLEQAQKFRPDVVESFQRLAKTGHVEFLDETYYHSLAGLWDDAGEFTAQVAEHRALTKELFRQEPTTFRNTELIYDNRIAHNVGALGYDAILTEGIERILGDRSPGRVYQPTFGPDPLRVLLKNYRLSDDVAFRFSSPRWSEFPLTADKYARWLSRNPDDTVNLFMDYETFGEHQWPETGIFEFLRHLPGEVRGYPHLGFALPREVAAEHEPVGRLDVPFAISWADTERDVSAWLGNGVQQTSFRRLRELAPLIQETDDPELTHAWRLLQTSDHLYYCSTKNMGDGDIHTYFSPYESPYIAAINLENVITDLSQKARAVLRH